jgi:hypothetical protein
MLRHADDPHWQFDLPIVAVKASSLWRAFRRRSA